MIQLPCYKICAEESQPQCQTLVKDDHVCAHSTGARVPVNTWVVNAAWYTCVMTRAEWVELEVGFTAESWLLPPSACTGEGK